MLSTKVFMVCAATVLAAICFTAVDGEGIIPNLVGGVGDTLGNMAGNIAQGVKDLGRGDVRGVWNQAFGAGDKYPSDTSSGKKQRLNSYYYYDAPRPRRYRRRRRPTTITTIEAVSRIALWLPCCCWLLYNLESACI